MIYKVKIADSLLTKTSKGYPIIKIKCIKENERVVYVDKFLSKKSKNLTKIEIIDMLEEFGFKIKRKFFITPKYLNKEIKKIVDMKTFCYAKYLYKNVYVRELHKDGGDLNWII